MRGKGRDKEGEEENVCQEISDCCRDCLVEEKERTRNEEDVARKFELSA